MSGSALYLGLQLALGALALTWSVLNHFIYAWSGDSAGTAWFAATDESVAQHLKMILWPWLILLLPLDLIWRSRGDPRVQSALAARGAPVVQPSYLTVVAANAAALASAMLFMSAVFAVIWYAAGETDVLGANIALFVVASVGGYCLRLALLALPQVAVALVVALMLYGMVWLFTYVSYRSDLRAGFWFDPHETDA